MGKKAKQLPIFPPPGRTRNELCAAASAAVMRDFLRNRFSFQGFPAVSAESVVGGVHLALSLGPLVTGPLFLSVAEATVTVNKFVRWRKHDDKFYFAVQELVVQLERLCWLEPVARSEGQSTT